MQERIIENRMIARLFNEANNTVSKENATLLRDAANLITLLLKENRIFECSLEKISELVKTLK